VQVKAMQAALSLSVVL